MASLRIECPVLIAPDVWGELLRRCPGVRCSPQVPSASAPVGEVFVPGAGWVAAFELHERSIAVCAEFDLRDAEHPLRRATSMLACLVDGEICSDDGLLFRW